MKLRKFKKYLCLCQCKGCMKKATRCIESSKYKLDDRFLIASVNLCEVHATEILLEPFWR